jgi:tRNA threonylcarbamoyladenosine biosynthesis protein TsaB
MGGTYSAKLITAVREVLEESGTTLKLLDAIVVMHGPGSFTGMRVGLSAAKGLSHASGVPVIALSRLAVMAGKISDEKVFVAIDAGRGELYLGQYRNQGTVCESETVVTREELEIRVGQSRVYLCEEKAQVGLAGSVDFAMLPQPTAEDCIPLAVRALAAGEFAPLAELDANYLRLSDAERVQLNTTMQAGQK